MKDQPSRSSVAAFAYIEKSKNFFKKVLTSPLKACNIMQVGGRQREHSTADSDETNEAKLLRKKNFEKFLTKQTH